MSGYRVLGAIGAWRRLEGQVAAAVLYAPKTAGDPAGADSRPEMHERCVIYLERHVVGTFWTDHLALSPYETSPGNLLSRYSNSGVVRSGCVAANGLNVRLVCG